MVPVECVARGYLSGSGWKEYQATGSVCGIRLAKRVTRKQPPSRADFHAGYEGRDWARY